MSVREGRVVSATYARYLRRRPPTSAVGAPQLASKYPVGCAAFCRYVADYQCDYVFQSYWAEKPMIHIYGHSWPIR